MTFHARALTGAIELKDAGDDDAAGIVNKALDELRTTVDGRLKAVETKSADATALIGRLDKLEARLNRPAVNTGGDEMSAERKAFLGYIRHGDKRPDLIETKALTVSSDPNGGFLAPDEFASELLKLTVEYSPIRQYSSVMNVGVENIIFPRRTGSVAATWVAEIDPRTPSQPTFEQVVIANHEMATYTDVSTKLLEDNAYSLESFLYEEFAERFGLAEGFAFTRGTGVIQPKGLLNATGTAQVKTGVAANFPAANPADVLIRMYHAIPTVHAARGVWIMNRNTLATVRTWKDAQGRYLVNDLIEGGASTLFGRPIVEAVDMPDVAAGTNPIIFGDLKGYRIVDRVGLSILRDPYSLGHLGQVRFHARKRVGADVTHPDRFVKLLVAV